MACAPSEDSDQPGHLARKKRAWVLSYLLNAQQRLWSDWMYAPGWSDSSLGAHAIFCQEAAQLFCLWSKFSDRQVWANSVDPEGAVWSVYTSTLFAIPSVCSDVLLQIKPQCPNFRTTSAKFLSVLDLIFKWTVSSEFGTYRICEQRRFRRACASAQSRQNLRCSLIQAVSQEEPSDRKPDPWPLWMAGHGQLKFVMTESSKTQIRLTGLKC